MLHLHALPIRKVPDHVTASVEVPCAVSPDYGTERCQLSPTFDLLKMAVTVPASRMGLFARLERAPFGLFTERRQLAPADVLAVVPTAIPSGARLPIARFVETRVTGSVEAAYRA